MCPIPEYPRTTEKVNHPLLPGITDTRLDRFFWGPYASQHVNKLLDRKRLDGSEHVKMQYWSAPVNGKPEFAEGVKELAEHGQELKKGLRFGKSWSNHWVKVDLTLPKELVREEQVIFEFDPSCEALIFASDGTPLHGITGGADSDKDGKPGVQEDRRVEHVVPRTAVEKGEYSIFIEVSCNGMFGVGTDGYRYQVPNMERTFPLVSADIVVPNLPVRALQLDFRILSQVARAPEARTSGLAQRALKACNDIMNSFVRIDGDESDPALLDGMVNACRQIGWDVLGPLDQDHLKILCVSNASDREAKVWAIGHCHIDTAWLWRYTQTQQKVARSWTTQCDLMDRWSNHQFAASSAQQYLWLEKLYPQGFERVKHYVKEKRFHVVGGAWLEHDCMIPSGEALCRQYLYGQRYFKSRFGEYCRESWLPDTFGYASQLPQILRSAGLQYFFTQKLSWNNINVFPYSTFNWCGIDGSQVLAHMTPVDSYNAQCNYGELVKGVQNNKNLGVTDQCLLLFGNGDGGGGPTPKMLQKLERLSSLSDKHPEVPNLKMGGPADFFDEICKNTNGGRTLPTWRGELYFELHRGTYTTQANIKKGNKDMETSLRTLEYFATLASLMVKGYEYPRTELEEAWQDNLLNQFHDVLPGTTISLVVDDVLEIYARRTAQVAKLTNEAIAALKARHTPSPTAKAEETILDPLRIARTEVTLLKDKLSWIQTDGTGLGRIVMIPSSPPKAYQKGDACILENARVRLTISNGRITSLVDIPLGRELVLAGPGATSGGLMLYEDFPLQYDAWDVEIYHLDTARELQFDKVRLGPVDDLRASLIAVARFGKSVAELTFSLDAIPTELDFQPVIRVDAKVDWYEQHKFLKFALPVDIHYSYATFATQFGLVERPTHRNTTHDQAKFEVCAHGLADLSENGYGVAICSRNKYGYAVEGNTMRLSLLRSPTSPDPNTDQGLHNFSFGIMPHHGRLSETNVQKVSMAFNEPLSASAITSVDASIWPTFLIEGDQSQTVILETIKRAEDETNGEKALILRLWESGGGRAKGSLKISNIGVKTAEWVNVLEEPVDEKCDLKNDQGTATVSLDFRCFEIKSLRVVVSS